MRDFEDTWPTAPMHLPTGKHRPDPRPFWTPIIATLIGVVAFATIVMVLL